MSSPGTPSYSSRSLPPVSLFSESPLISMKHGTGPGGDDLSLSELSIPDTPPVPVPYTSRTPPQRFSLFGQGDEENMTQDLSHVTDPSPTHDEASHDAQPDESFEQDEGPQDTPIKQGNAAQQAARSREEELRSTLFQLRKLNSIFSEYMGALHKSEDHSRRLLEQVESSHRLLNFYTSLLGQTEHTTQLLLDPGWQGALADEEHAAEQARAEERRKQREKEEQERARILEQERIEREEKERQAAEERERAKAERGRADGRGRARGSTSSNRGSGAPTSASSTRGRGIPTGIRRPTAGRTVTSRARGRGG
ncbi:hypothetical protein FRC03_009418 [Tulasnella sp. 419]|nr:hypothetical protein FRC03_009418 [Tulasnella sp. 419]